MHQKFIHMSIVSLGILLISIYSARGEEVGDKLKNHFLIQDTIAPVLAVDPQRVVEGREFSYMVDEIVDISYLRPNENYIITIDNDAGTNISYDPATKIFSFNSGLLGAITHNTVYTILGKIRDGETPANESSWSFNVEIVVNPSPRLELTNQTIEAGQNFFYNIGNLTTGIDSDETMALTLNTNNNISLDLNYGLLGVRSIDTVGSYTVAGTISDGYKSANWAFVLTVRDTVSPQLNIHDQVILGGQRFEYTINDAYNITDLRNGEAYTIAMADTVSNEITYDPSSKKFTLSTPTANSYTVNGTISDGINTSNWSFGLKIKGSMVPMLQIPRIVVYDDDSFSYTINEQTEISNVPSGEGYTIKVNYDGGAGVTYNPTTKTFMSTNPLNPGTLLISGTISRSTFPVMTSNWSFEVNVTMINPIDRVLAIPPQVIRVGQSFSYTIQESDKIGPFKKTSVIRLGSDGGSGLVFSNNTFSKSTPFSEVGKYIVRGTVVDGTQSNDWYFSLNVTNHIIPTLKIPNYHIRGGYGFTHTINKQTEISNLPLEEDYILTVEYNSVSGITYNPTTKTFSSTRNLMAGKLFITGTIAGASSPNVTSNWSFEINVGIISATDRALIIQPQWIRVGQAFSYTIREENKVGGFTEASVINFVSDGGSGVVLNGNTFIRSTPFTEVGQYLLKGTIVDGAKSNGWYFALMVIDNFAPILKLPDIKTIDGGGFSHTINEQNEIFYLPPGEQYIIEIADDSDTRVTYNTSTKTFSGSGDYYPGKLLISGTIASVNGPAIKSNWSFEVDVAAVGSAQRWLAIAPQKVRVGQMFSYRIQETDKKGPFSDSSVINLTSDGGSRVVLSNNTFTRSTPFTRQGTYTLRGTVTDGTKINQWYFVLVVRESFRPVLKIPNARVLDGDTFSHTIREEAEISYLPPGEKYIIKIEYDSGGGATYNPITKTFNLDYTYPGKILVAGTIAAASTPMSTSNWSFEIDIFIANLTYKTALAIAPQTAKVGQTFSYTVQPLDRIGTFSESAVINLTTDSGSGVTLNNNTFTRSSSFTTAGRYLLRGTITNDFKASPWYFILIVTNSTIPTLNIPDITRTSGNNFSYIIKESAEISNLPLGGSYVITVNSDSGAGVTYDSTTKMFRSSRNLTPGKLLISGIIASADTPTLKSNWSFKVNVRRENSTGTELAIPSQRLIVGQKFSYTIQESDKIGLFDESSIINLINNGGSGVYFSANTFSRSTPFTKTGKYILRGNIVHGNDSIPWYFILNVDGPEIKLVDQVIDLGQKLNYQISDDQNIIGVTSGETYAVNLLFSSGSGVSYDPTTASFVGTPQHPGRYSINGNIVSAGRIINWSFNVDVNSMAPPTLAIPNQSVKRYDFFEYFIKKENIIDRMISNRYVINLTDDAGLGISLLKNHLRSTAISAIPGEYILRGTIADPNLSDNVGSWSFKLYVLQGKYNYYQPSLITGEKVVEVDNCFTYTLTRQDFSGLSGPEFPRIVIDSSDGTGVYLNGHILYSTRVFNSGDNSFSVKGKTISMGREIPFEFTIRVKDSITPMLSIADQEIFEGDSFLYTVRAGDISHRRSTEDIKIYFFDSNSSFVKFDNRVFRADNLRAGLYRIWGKISDGVNFSKWSFLLRVREKATILKVTNLIKSDSSLWSWNCSNTPCNYRYLFTSIPPGEFSTSDFTMSYAPNKTTTQPSGEGYFYVQARDASNNESIISYVRYEDNTSLSAKQVVTGDWHSCALIRETAKVVCWGNNSNSQLGVNANDNISEKLSVNLGTNVTVQSISAGNFHTCALLHSSTGAKQVKCWGFNHQYQLGQGHNNNLGKNANQMGDGLAAVNLGRNAVPKSVYAGGYNTCVILENGQVKCWGRDDVGNSRGNSPGDMGDNLATFALGTNLTARSISYYAGKVCVTLSNNNIKCWRDWNTSPEVLSLNTSSDIKSFAINGYARCVVLKNGQAKCWGFNRNGILGRDDASNIAISSSQGIANISAINLGTNPSGNSLQAKSISLGSNFACSVLMNGQVKCWGMNDFGQLGQDHTDILGNGINQNAELVIEMGNNLNAISLGEGVKVKSLSVNTDHVCALTDDNRVKCWGGNNDGQSGPRIGDHIGDGLTLGGVKITYSEMGDHLPYIKLGTIPSGDVAFLNQYNDLDKISSISSQNFIYKKTPSLLHQGDDMISGDNYSQLDARNLDKTTPILNISDKKVNVQGKLYATKNKYALTNINEKINPMEIISNLNSTEEPDLDIIYLLKENFRWQWRCNKKDCHFRYLFTHSSPDFLGPIMLNQAYEDINFVLAPLGDYYLYVQALDRKGNESAIIAFRYDFSGLTLQKGDERGYSHCQSREAMDFNNWDYCKNGEIGPLGTFPRRGIDLIFEEVMQNDEEPCTPLNRFEVICEKHKE